MKQNFVNGVLRNIIIINLILCLCYSQSKKIVTSGNVGADVIKVVNLTQNFVIESDINPEHYILGPSDKLGVNIVTDDNTTFILSITPTGDLWIPQVGAVHISGLSLSQAKKYVENFVREHSFTNAKVELVILNLRSFLPSLNWIFSE